MEHRGLGSRHVLAAVSTPAHKRQLAKRSPSQQSAPSAPAASLAPLAAEEMSLCYQFSAHAASDCCIAIGQHQRWQLWVNERLKRALTQGPAVGLLFL